MDPFIPEKEERITHNQPTRAAASSRGLTLLVVVVSAVLVTMCAVLITMMLSQQQTFTSLQENVQRLQQDAGGETAPEPAAPPPDNAGDEQSPQVKPETIAALESELAGARKSVSALEDRLKSLEQSAAKTSGNVDTAAIERAVNSQTGKLAQELSRLKKDVLELRLTMEELQGSIAGGDSGLERRLNSIEAAVTSINRARQRENNAGSGDVSATLQRLEREIRLLKKQHPYLGD